MEVPITNLPLSIRAYNCLKGEGIKTIGQLLEYSLRDLLRIKRLGPKTLWDIRDTLDDYGLSLPETDSYQERQKRAEYAHELQFWGYVTEATLKRWVD